LRDWERGGNIGLAEAPLVTILQIARGWSDAEVAARAGVDADQFEALRAVVDTARGELRQLIYRPSTRARLAAEGFGARLDVAALQQAWRQARSAAARAECVAEALSTT